jgi:hypothetical protein
MTAPTRLRLPFTVLALVVAAATVALTLGVQSAPAASYKSCSLSERDRDPPGAKPTYNLTLRRQVTSCKTAKKVMYAFHKCRSKTRYTCTKRLLSHWRCTGKRESSIPTQFNASFTCKWGTRRVRSSYQQYT